jgi:hypothetical protein
MSTTLALETWQAVATTLAILSALAIVTIVVAPWREVRAEPPLDDTAETRILLGEDPKRIAEDEARDDRDAGDGRADEPYPAA